MHWAHYDPDRHTERTVRQRNDRQLMHEEGSECIHVYFSFFLLQVE